MRASSSGMTLTLQSAAAAPDMLEQLASGRYFIFHDAGDGRLVGTGAFILTDASHSKIDGKPSLYTLQANNSCWAGRPFLDRVEITAGLPALKRLLDLELGQADVIELAPELVRRAQQEDLRVWTSDPVTLFGLRFPDGGGAEQARLREVISLSLDRVTMAGVLLQRQAQPAAALLPEWLSGYASLFSIESDSERERERRDAAKLSSAAAGDPMLLRVDAPGELAKLLGDRVALNARQKGINLQIAGKNQQTRSAQAASAEVRLFLWRFTSVSAPAELAELQASLRVSDAAEPGGAIGELQQVYARERKLLEDRRVAPLVLLPEYVGLSANIRDWMPARWGEWHLADAWLDAPAATSAPTSETSSRAPAGVKP
jgi:MarR-like DNA-binding transcriptional regulator SgrR of sgrS sRNA